MADINALYASLLAADEGWRRRGPGCVAWQMYGQLATTAADLGALRARFRIYAAAPHASGRRLAPRGAQTGACVAGRRATQGDVSADEEADRGGVGVAGHRGTTSTMCPAVRERPGPGIRCL